MRTLWRCPKCGNRFVTRGLWHACGRYRLADFGRLGYGVHLRLTAPDDIDRRLEGLMREAHRAALSPGAKPRS